MARFQQVTLEDIPHAPVLLRLDRPIGAPRRIVWDLLAGDPARWGDFCPGFDHSGHWTTPPTGGAGPGGVGAVRRVRVGRLTFHDLVLAHDEAVRWAFRVESATLPLATGLAEDYLLSDAPGGCTLHWTAGVWPHGPVALARPVLTAALISFAGKLVHGLERAARASTP